MIPWIALSLQLLAILLFSRKSHFAYLSYAFASIFWAWQATAFGSELLFVAHLVFVVVCLLAWVDHE